MDQLEPAVRSTEGLAPVCKTTEKAFLLFSRKWAGLILHVLTERPLYFNELLACLPSVKARVLVERLRELEAAAMVIRQVQPEAGNRVAYSLSPKGRELVPLLADLAEWAHRWEDQPGQAN